MKNRHGQVFQVTCQRHCVCWRFIICSSSGKFVGELLFEPQDATTVKLLEFHIERKFASKGIGSNILDKFQNLVLHQGFLSIVGICKSYDRPLSEKEKLARWYMNHGFTLLPESLEGEPGYMGKLTKDLRILQKVCTERVT